MVYIGKVCCVKNYEILSMCIEKISGFRSSCKRQGKKIPSITWFLIGISALIGNISLLIYFDLKLWNQISLSLSMADDLKYVLKILLIDWNQNSFEKDIIEMKFSQLLNSKQDVYLSQETFDILRGLSIILGIYDNHYLKEKRNSVSPSFQCC